MSEDYKKDPLWLKAQRDLEENLDIVCSYADTLNVSFRDKELANVVLSYFDGSDVESIKEFAKALDEFADNYKASVRFSHKYAPDLSKAEGLRKSAEMHLTELWNDVRNDLHDKPDERENNEPKLNTFQRFLNHCILFLKGK
jgi:hypothetical protein